MIRKPIDVWCETCGAAPGGKCRPIVRSNPHLPVELFDYFHFVRIGDAEAVFIGPANPLYDKAVAGR